MFIYFIISNLPTNPMVNDRPPPRTNLMIFVSNPANGDVCRTQTTGVGNRESPGSTSILEKIWKYHIQYLSIFNFWIEEVPEICEHLELKVIFMV